MVSPSHASVFSHSTDSFCEFDSLCLKEEILSEAKKPLEERHLSYSLSFYS